MSDPNSTGRDRPDVTPEPPPPPPGRGQPPWIGRYRVERLLGQGGFGAVYQARDEQLHRSVAIKVPHRGRISRPEDAEAYLAEARVVASLDHPHIVPVHDVGRTEDGLPFVVSKLIEGCTLADWIRVSPLSISEATELTATVAEALHHAHHRGVFHRDVKPSNILLDAAGKPYVTDFGLALKEEDFGKGPAFAGTLAYMSPEQARGEGHRVDGRSDVFSLGVVFYELLTGRRPFRGEDRAELLERIENVEPRPPRQINDAIPKELERVCLRALSKRASERYTTARDFAEELRAAVAAPAGDSRQRPPAWTPSAGPPTSNPTVQEITPPVSPPTSEQKPLRIVPKGLRSFDAHDADFFIELLPGPRDRNGLPDVLRFWKTRIEETDPDRAFSVGLLYGPSGCGKSSLVKAGLLPRLSGDVIPVYVEATPRETEVRLKKGLRKACPGLPNDLGLVETLTTLRRKGNAHGAKVLIVLDQFEQWLHGRVIEGNTPLVGALRQCDGEKVQALVLVRDDFWMAATRFMRELEIPLEEGKNSAPVDLFPLRHAERVLTAFGRAFGVLPESNRELTGEQTQFLDRAVQGLAREGKVVCVRLALFAEMMKGRAWTPAALKEVGGTEGVGVTFLEETFSAATAPPEHRYHQKAARAVLNALLPESGTDLKGYMRSEQELLRAAGYAGRPGDFQALLRILDGELRLLTPTDPESGTGEAEDPAPAREGQKYFQLTHDYLVPALRHWLTRKQKETRRGRAELRLEDRAALWRAKPENRYLPSWPEWATILLLTRRTDWTAAQRRMMGRATRYHSLRAAVLAAVLVISAWVGWEGWGRFKARALTDRLLDAPITSVPEIIQGMGPYRSWANPLLRATLAEGSEVDPARRLRASLALLPMDTGQVEYLHERLLTAEAQDFAVVRDALARHRKDLVGSLWTIVADRKAGEDTRFRAACALAEYDGRDDRWNEIGREVASRLVKENPVTIGYWIEALRPVRASLMEPLADILESDRRSEAERSTATNLLAAFARGGPESVQILRDRLAREIPPGSGEETQNEAAKKRANVAAALVQMGHLDPARTVLRHSPDPTTRTYLIHRIGPSRVEARTLFEQWGKEQEPSIRQALLLSLGEFEADRLSRGELEEWLPRLWKVYREDPDPGIHGATEWLLRRWNQGDKLKNLDAALATGKVEGDRRWYQTRQGQSMMIIPPPGQFWLGEANERRQIIIKRSYAIASKEVTIKQFLRFKKSHSYVREVAPSRDCPVNGVSWYEAAAYCNWLSEAEGIPESERCYRTNEKGEYAEGMKIVPEAVNKTGYRLPTDSEWEYACRAGVNTRYCFGEAEDLAPRYAWFILNSNGLSHPVGLLKPNDLGLFDMHGNAWEWCQGVAQVRGQGPEGKALEELQDVFVVDERTKGVRRVVRGGWFNETLSNIRSPARNWIPPSFRNECTGFRPARTIQESP